MNILQINTLDSKGGAAKIAQQIHSRLKQNHHTSKMLVKIKETHDDDVLPIEYTGIIKILSDILLKITNRNLFDFIRFNHIKITANDIEYFKKNDLFDKPEYKNADIVHIHNLHGNYFPLNYLRRISREKRLVWTLHDMWALTGHAAQTSCHDWQNGCENCNHLNIYQELPWNNSKYLWGVKKNIYKDISVNVVVPCKWLMNNVKKSILSNKELFLIHNGVDTKLFSPNKNKNELKKKHKIPLEKKICLFVAYNGFNNDWKGGSEIEKIVLINQQSGDWHFVCVGSSNKSTKYKNLTSFQNTDNEETMSEYYQISDVLIFLSQGETSPLTIMEAMSSGLYIIANDVGGIPELATKIGSKIITDMNHQLVINSLDEFNNFDNKHLSKIRSTNRNFIKQNYDLEKMLTNYICLYQQMHQPK